jgi:LmbE family N-acetylglucosaminyl deacetylase
VKVLITAAHPDDADFVCGGTIANLTENGHQVSVVVATSGEAGLARSNRTIREAEQRAAATLLGVDQVRFLQLSDGLLEPGQALRRELSRAIRQFRPDLVITHTPRRNLASVRSSHPDHLAVGEATMCAVYPDARNPRAHPDLLDEHGLQPHIVGEVWIHGTGSEDHPVEITEVFERKMSAILCHDSQLAGLGPDPRGFFHTWGIEVAQRHGLAAGTLAEEYLRVDTQ